MTLNRLQDYLNAQADFMEDKRTQQAVVMSLIVLGEAATKVMDQYPAFAFGLAIRAASSRPTF